MPQLSFDEIKGLHAQAQASGNPLGSKDLKGFATTMQEYDPHNDWSQGTLPDNFVTGLSRGIDKAAEATGLPQVAADAGGSLGGLIDSVRGNGNDQKYQQLGSEIGRGIPRMAGAVGLGIAGTLAAPETAGASLAAWAPAAGMLGLGAADMGIKAYSDTGSVGAGLTSAAIGLAAPGISSVGSKVGLSALGKVAPALAENGVAKFIASEIGQQTAFFGATAVPTIAQGENPLTPENLFAQGLQTAAFAPLSVYHGVKAARSRAAVEPGVSPKGEIIPFDKTINPSGELTDAVYNDNSRLFDFVTGKQDGELKKTFEQGNVKQALELTGLIDPDISNALETSARRYKGREMISTLAEQNDSSHWEANDRLFKKAATLLQTPEVDVRDMVQRIAATNAFARKFADNQPFTPAGLLENKPSFDMQQQYESMQQRFGAGAAEASATRSVFNEAQASADTKAKFDSLPNRRARELAAEQARVGNPVVNDRTGTDVPIDYTAPDAALAEVVPSKGKVRTPQSVNEAAKYGNPKVDPELGNRPNDYIPPDGSSPARVRGKVDPNGLESKLFRPEWSKIDAETTQQVSIDDFDFKTVGRNENGMQALGPGIYFSEVVGGKNTVGNAYKTRGDLVIRGQIEDANIVPMFERIPDHLRPRLEAAAQEIGFAGLDDMHEKVKGVSGLRHGRGFIGEFVKSIGNEKTRELMVKHGIDGMSEKLPNGGREFVIYNKSAFKPTEQLRQSTGETTRFSLLDSRGEITRTTFEKAYYENLKLEGDPERAMARTDAQVRGALMGKMKDARPDAFHQDGLSVASRTFDEAGLAPEMKARWLESTHRVLERMTVFEGTQVRTMDEMVTQGLVPKTLAQQAYGVFISGVHHIGMDTRNHQATQELGAFHFVKTIGHEAFHAMSDLARSDAAYGLDSTRFEAYKKAIEYADSVDAGTREGLLRQLQMALVPPEQFKADTMRDNRLGKVAQYAAATSDEFVTEYGSMLAMSLSRPEATVKTQESLRWAPQAVQDFANGLFRTISELKQMVLTTAQFLGLGHGQIQELNQFHKNLELMLTPDPVTVKAKRDVQSAMQPFAVLNGELSPLDVKWSKIDSPAVEEAAQSFRTANLFEKRFGTLQQHVNSLRVKEAIPNAGRVVDALTTLGADIKKSLNVMRSNLMVMGDGGLLHELATTADKSLTPEQIALKSNFGRVDGSLENRAKLSAVYLKMNELVRDLNEDVTFEHPELQKLLVDSKPEDVAAMKAVFDAQIEVNKNAAALVQNSYLDRTVLDVARIYKGAGLVEADAMQTSKILVNSMFQNKPVPPELNQIAGTDNAVNFWTGVRPAYEELVSTMSRPHASELRTGRYQITYDTASGEQGRIGANNKQELAAMQRELTKQGNKLTGVVDNQNKEFSEFDAVPTAMAESLVRLEQARFDSALNNLDPATAEKIRAEYTLGQGISEEINKRKQFLAERKYSPGREHIDMYSNQGAYAEVVAASVTKKIARNRIAWELESDNWNKDPGLKKEVEAFAHDILSTRNSSELTQNIKKGTMFVTMGANVSGALMDSMQALNVGTFRIAETMGTPEAFKTISKGYLEAFNPKNTEFQSILTRATNDGLLQSGATWEEAFRPDDHAGYNVAKAGDRRNLATLQDHLTDREFMAGKVFDMIKGYGGKLVDGIMIPTKASGQLNNKVMLYAGMVEGQKLGLKGEELYRHAVRVSQVTNFQGGRGAQSSFKTKFGQANNWVETATLLTNYPISVISQMYGNYRSMLKSSGLPPAKRQRAAEVFAGQLTMQFAMAGGLGLGLGTLFKVTEKIFGFSPEEEVRKGLAELDSSGNLADILLNGVANKVTGVDFASRFSLGGIAGFNDYTGFDAKGVFGPSTTLWAGLANLPSDIMEGNVDKSMLMPNGIRKMMEATAQGPIKDRSGQTLIDPTTTERILKFVGFNSSRLAQVQDQRSLYKFADQSTQRDTQIKTNQRIELLNKGDFGGVLKSLQEDTASKVAQWRSEGIPQMTISKMVEKETRSKAMDLVKAAVQKTLPIDPLSGGTNASSSRRQAIAATYGAGLTPRETMAQREQLAQRLLMGLGQAAAKRSPRAVRISNLVQQLIAADPTMTDQQAQVLAESQIQ